MKTFNHMIKKIQIIDIQQNCPECGEKMHITDRLSENGAVFVWYGCNKNECDGQWLQRIPASLIRHDVSNVGERIL